MNIKPFFSILISLGLINFATAKPVPVEDHITLLKAYTQMATKAKMCQLTPEYKIAQERYDSKVAYLKRITNDLEIVVAMEVLSEKTEKSFQPNPSECAKVKQFINKHLSARD